MKRNETIILREKSESDRSDQIGRILEFFGVSWREMTAEQFVQEIADAPEDAAVRLLSSIEVLTPRWDKLVAKWQSRVHSVFLYGGNDRAVVQTLWGKLAPEVAVKVSDLSTNGEGSSVSFRTTDLAGVMSGMDVSAQRKISGFGLSFIPELPSNVVELAAMKGQSVFLKINFQDVPIFVSGAKEIVDIAAPLEGRNFDVRDHALTAVPLVLYVRWAFGTSCWHANEAKACLVIDDPLLKPSYGFVNFFTLLELMQRHRFTTNVAFIPWNWRRSRGRVVQLFQQHRDKYSLSIHGCDHSGGEFGGQNGPRLRFKARQAQARMRRHENRTGLRHDRVMVFPQGVFSTAAMAALRESDYVAAVNTEVIGKDANLTPIRIADVWNTAVLNYANFPIFTRRYAFQGIENYVFDLLLGKPCIIVSHHDFFRDEYLSVVNLVKKLNSLSVPVNWRSLGEVVERGFRQRVVTADEIEVEMFATVLRLENDSDLPRRFHVKRRETAPETIAGIEIDSTAVSWRHDGGVIEFQIDLAPRASATIAVKFHPPENVAEQRESIRYLAKTWLRRFCSEVRDDYVMKSRWLTKIARLVRGK